MYLEARQCPDRISYHLDFPIRTSTLGLQQSLNFVLRSGSKPTYLLEDRSTIQ